MAVSQLSHIFIATSSAPGVDLALGVHGDTVEISAGDVDDLLSDQFLYFMDSVAFVSCFVPQLAAPREEEALGCEGESVVIAARYFFDGVLGHRGEEVELAEIVYLGFHADLAEKEGAGHVYLPLSVGYGGVAAGRSDLVDNSSEPADGHGLVDYFCA